MTASAFHSSTPMMRNGGGGGVIHKTCTVHNFSSSRSETGSPAHLKGLFDTVYKYAFNTLDDDSYTEQTECNGDIENQHVDVETTTTTMHNLTPHLDSGCSDYCSSSNFRTDMQIVASCGKLFQLHQMILASCSQFACDLLNESRSSNSHNMSLPSHIRSSSGNNLEPSSSATTTCGFVVLHLPDFNSNTIKSFITLIYTGKSLTKMDDHESVTSLYSLLESFKIDLNFFTQQNTQKSSIDGSSAYFYNKYHSSIKRARRTIDDPQSVLPSTSYSRTRSSTAVDSSFHDTGYLTKDNSSSSDEMCVVGLEEEEEEYVVELTPDVEMFAVQNHFLHNDDENNDTCGGSGREVPSNLSNKEDRETSEESNLVIYEDDGCSSGGPSPHNIMENNDGCEDEYTTLNNSCNSNGPQPQQLSTMASSLMNNAKRQGYMCRLCGKYNGSSAALFAHFLYPHYAHLWRDQVPIKSSKYDCSECSYTTSKRQNFIMHLARVHEGLRKKLEHLDEDPEIIAILATLVKKNMTSHDDTQLVRHATNRVMIESSIAKVIRGGVASSGSAGNVIKTVIEDLTPQAPQSPEDLSNSKNAISNRAISPTANTSDTSSTAAAEALLKSVGWKENGQVSISLKPSPSCSTQHSLPLTTTSSNQQQQTMAAVRESAKPHSSDDEEMRQLKESCDEYGAEFVKPRKSYSSFSSTVLGGGTVGGGGSYNGSKPTVKCRLCGRAWKGKDNFFTHLVSTHYKYMWAGEVPQHADIYYCQVDGCEYTSRYRYNFLFHLAGKHRQLKTRLEEAGIPVDVLEPIELGSEEDTNTTGLGGVNQQNGIVSSGSETNVIASKNGGVHNERRKTKLGKGWRNMNKRSLHSSSSANVNVNVTNSTDIPFSTTNNDPSSLSANTENKLICVLCSKVTCDATAHRAHMVTHHFIRYWSHITPVTTVVGSETAGGGTTKRSVFVCEYVNCSYETTNRNVFAKHLAYTHDELWNKLNEDGVNGKHVDNEMLGTIIYGKTSNRTRQPSTQSKSESIANSTPLNASIGDGENSQLLSMDGIDSVTAAQSATAATNSLMQLVSSQLAMMSAASVANHTQHEDLSKNFTSLETPPTEQTEKSRYNAFMTTLLTTLTRAASGPSALSESSGSNGLMFGHSSSPYVLGGGETGTVPSPVAASSNGTEPTAQPID